MTRLSRQPTLGRDDGRTAAGAGTRPPGAALGPLLRAWRARRHVSQHALALAADVSQRHLSFIELGTARASRELVLRLGEQLDLPLRERNHLLLAAGYAPAFTDRPFSDPMLAPGRSAVERLLAAQAPAPALAVDHRWTLLAANATVAPVLLAGVSAALLRTPVNILRVTLHPEGLGPRILNGAAWRAGILGYLERQVSASGDPVLRALLGELREYPPLRDESSSPGDPAVPAMTPGGGEEVFLPLLLRSALGPLTLLSTITVFATPTAVVLAELLIETFLPADATTAERLRALADPSAAT